MFSRMVRCSIKPSARADTFREDMNLFVRGFVAICTHTYIHTYMRAVPIYRLESQIFSRLLGNNQKLPTLENCSARGRAERKVTRLIRSAVINRRQIKSDLPNTGFREREKLARIRSVYIHTRPCSRMRLNVNSRE